MPSGDHPHWLLPLSPLPTNSLEYKPDPFRQLQHLCASVLNRLPGRAHQQQTEQALEHGGQLQSSAGTVHGNANRLQGIETFSTDAQPSHQRLPHDLRAGLHQVTELLHVSCPMECTSLFSKQMHLQIGSTSKEELGRATWTLLHTLAAQYPETPTYSQQKDAQQLVCQSVLMKQQKNVSTPRACLLVLQVDVLTRIYPCADCARHFQDIVR